MLFILWHGVCISESVGLVGQAGAVRPRPEPKKMQTGGKKQPSHGEDRNVASWKEIGRRIGFGGRDKSELKLPKPGEMLAEIGRDLVTVYQLEPDNVWGLKCVLRPVDAKKKVFLFRVFSDKKTYAAGVKVLNYDSLDSHPELVLYSGQVNRVSREVRFGDLVRPAA